MQWAPAYSNKIYPLFSSGFVTLHSVHTGMPKKPLKRSASNKLRGAVLSRKSSSTKAGL